jgi:hypothetical protein
MVVSDLFRQNLGPAAAAYGGAEPTRATTDSRGRAISSHDWVPAEGPWQADPELRRLLALPGTRNQAGRTAGSRPSDLAVNPEVRRYVDANRARLGIPENYYPEANGQLFDPGQNQLRNAGIATGAALGAAVGGAALTGAFAPAATAAPVAAPALAAPATAATTAATTAGTVGTGLWGGLKASDLITGGAGLTQALLQNRAQNQALDASADATRAQSASEAAALDFLKLQYEEQKRLEQARWDANEARRAPYREASQQTLGQLKALTSGVEGGPVRRTAT